MTLQEFYGQIGGDYQTACARFLKDERIEKYVLKFANDKSYENLAAAMAAEDWAAGFEAAHSLKGVSLNLAFEKLSGAATELTEALREGNRGAHDAAELHAMFDAVEQEYQRVCGAIEEYSR